MELYLGAGKRDVDGVVLCSRRRRSCSHRGEKKNMHGERGPDLGIPWRREPGGICCLAWAAGGDRSRATPPALFVTARWAPS